MLVGIEHLKPAGGHVTIACRQQDRTLPIIDVPLEHPDVRIRRPTNPINTHNLPLPKINKFVSPPKIAC
jgi:hypothetical protein